MRPVHYTKFIVAADTELTSHASLSTALAAIDSLSAYDLDIALHIYDGHGDKVAILDSESLSPAKREALASHAIMGELYVRLQRQEPGLFATIFPCELCDDGWHPLSRITLTQVGWLALNCQLDGAWDLVEHVAEEHYIL